jgi:hypothetical protein
MLLRLAEIPSARAEAATYRVNEVLAGFRTRSVGLVAGSEEAHQAARDAILHIVSIAEMFAGEHLVDIAEQRLPDDDLVLRIWDERMPRIVRDWIGRKAGWKQLFDLNWTYRYWPELNGFITARNIIAHGMGELTRSQLQRGAIRDSVSKSLTSAKLTLRGRKLVPMDADVERAGRRVAHFVTWLDEQSRVMAT